MLSELGLDVQPRLEYVDVMSFVAWPCRHAHAPRAHCTYRYAKVEEPAARKGGVKVESVDELIDKLRNEAKVL